MIAPDTIDITSERGSEPYGEPSQLDILVISRRIWVDGVVMVKAWLK